MSSSLSDAVFAGPTLPPIAPPTQPFIPSHYTLWHGIAHIADLSDPDYSSSNDDEDDDDTDEDDDTVPASLPPPIPRSHLSSSSSALLLPTPSSNSITNHRCPFRPHPAAAQCDTRADNIKDVATHYLRKHVIPGRTKADDFILQQLPPLANHTCPLCKRIYIGIRKHTGRCDPSIPRSSVSRYTKEGTTSGPRPRTHGQRSQRNQHRDRPPTYSIEHPLPLLRPQIWEHIPQSQLTAVIDLVRPGLTAYAHAQPDDLVIKTRIITDLHRFPSLVLNKVRTDHGKAERSLGRRVTSPELQRELFAEFRHLPPAAGATAAVAAPPVIEVWTDGSSKPVEGKGKVADANREANNKKQLTGIGLVVLDHRIQPPTGLVEYSAFLDNGTNNTAELAAVIYAMELYATEPSLPLTIHTDSQYVIGAAAYDAVNENGHLIYHLRTMISKRSPRPVFHKVAAHVNGRGGDPNNARADELAGTAREAHLPLPPPTSELHRLLKLPSSHQRIGSLLSSSAPVVPDQLPPVPSLSSSPPTTPAPDQQHHQSPQRNEQISASHIQLPKPHDPAAQLRSRVLRAKALVRRGLIKEAIQLIERAPLPELTAKRIEHLIALHPRRTRPIPSPSSLLSAIPPVLDVDQLRKLIRQCDKGKSPGPSNLTAGHLEGLSQDQQCMAGLVAIIQDIASGNLSPEATDIITSSVSVATDKTNGSDPASDQVRPLAVPEILYKLAGMFLISSLDQYMSSLFPTIQLGCGRKNGVESALHRTQIALEAGGDGSDTVVLSLDFRNAFNQRQRHTIANALYRAPNTSRLWRFFNLCYGSRAAHLGIYDRGTLIYRFINDDGVRQGCPVAAFLYALSVQHIYEAAVRGVPGLEAVAIADDFTITGPALSVARALQQLVEACKDDGPILNFGKCKALWAYSTNHPSYAPFCAAMSSYGEPIPISYDAIPLLGAGVGLGNSRARFCNNAIQQHSNFFAAITHADMPVQAAMLLLRVSGIPRLTYLTRVIPPVIIREACEKFDAMIMRTVADKCNLPDPATNTNVRRQITLPYRCAGMAFPPHTRSSPAAYYSSMAASAHTIMNHSTPGEMEQRLRATDTAFHLADTHSILLATGVDPALKGNRERLPAEADEFWSFFAGSSKVRPHLQKHLTRLMTNKMYRSDPTPLPLIEAMAAATAAAMSDSGEADAPVNPTTPSTSELLFTTYPTSAHTNIADHEYRLALRHRLRLPVVDHLPSHCKGCSEPITDPAHWHSCPSRKKKGNYCRHEKIVLCLQTLARRAGIFVTKEKAIRDSKGKRTVPDLKFSTAHTGVVHIDVTVCGSFADSNQHPRAKDVRAAEKTKQHYPGAAAECATFIPFVVDSLGNFGAGAWQIIDLIVGADLAQSAKGDQHTTPELTRMNIARAIAIQIQAGNAAIDLDALVANGIPLHIRNLQQPHHLDHPSLPQPQHPTRPPLPTSIHDTLLRRPAPVAAIPSVVRAAAAAAAAAATSPDGKESKEQRQSQQQHQHEPQELKRGGSASAARAPPADSPATRRHLPALAGESPASSANLDRPSPQPPTTSSSSSSSSSSAAAVIFLQTTLDLADFTATAAHSSSPSSSRRHYIDDNIPTAAPRHPITCTSSSSSASAPTPSHASRPS
jgi:ribonuclease HI